MASVLDAWEWPMANCELVLFSKVDLAPYFHSQTGEIDIIEGVHDNEHNQVTWHTSAGHLQGVVVFTRMLTRH